MSFGVGVPQTRRHTANASDDRASARRARGGRWWRTIAAWLAALAVVVPPAAALLDAARPSGRLVAHVEAPHSSSCVAVHGDECGLCQLAVATADAPLATPAPPALQRLAGAPLRARGWQPAAVLRRADSARSPPALV